MLCYILIHVLVKTAQVVFDLDGKLFRHGLLIKF